MLRRTIRKKLGLGGFIFLLVFLLLSVTACATETVTPPAPIFLKATGSSSAAPLFSALGAAFNQEHPHITIDVTGGGSQLGEQQIKAGRVDFGLVSKQPVKTTDDLRVVPVGRDAVAIILHRQNPVTGLSQVELRNIFSGRIFNWQAVDGNPSPIQVVSREDGSGTRATFETTIMNDNAVTPNAVVLPNSQAITDFVAQNPNAVGYVSFVVANKGNVYTVPIEGSLPTQETVADSSYPITRNLAVIVANPGKAEVNAFLEFALGPAGQQVVGRQWGRVN